MTRYCDSFSQVQLSQGPLMFCFALLNSYYLLFFPKLFELVVVREELHHCKLWLLSLEILIAQHLSINCLLGGFQKHRVLIPEEEVKQRIVRRSLAFFVHPDNEVMIECLDGSNKHPPITSMGYLQQRFAATY